MRRWGIPLSLLLLGSGQLFAQSSAPDPSEAFGQVVTAATGYVLSALAAVAVLFGLVLGIRFFIGIARRSVR